MYRIRQCTKKVGTSEVYLYYPELLTCAWMVPRWNFWTRQKNITCWGKFYYNFTQPPIDFKTEINHDGTKPCYSNDISFSTKELALSWLTEYVKMRSAMVQIAGHAGEPAEEYKYEYYTETFLKNGNNK